MAESWKCALCGHEGNGGRFCNECGAPKDRIMTGFAGMTFREPEKTLTLQEARDGMLPAGWLTEVTSKTSESGMMMGSLHNTEEVLRWEGDGSVTMKIVDSRPYQTEKTSLYLVRQSEAEAVRAFVLSENLAAWARLKELPPDPWGVPYDRSYSSSLQLQYEHEDGEPAGTYSISPALANRHGGGEALKELGELLRRCRERGTLLSEEERPGAFPGGIFSQGGKPGGAPSGGLHWKCPCCGAAVAEQHRFCPECGTPKWKAEE